MKEQIIKMRNRALSWKMYIGRSASYVSLLNLGMIMFLTLSRLKELGYIKMNLTGLAIPIYLCTLSILIFFGYLDIHHIRGYGTEINLLNRVTPLHPELAELKRKVDYLYENNKTN